nr:hypothetical protein [uncultured Draconibacterium sp.]
MGLEAANYLFQTKEELPDSIKPFEKIFNFEENKYIFKKDNEFWIDIEIQNKYTLSIQITLCNPKDRLFHAFQELLSYLFTLKGSLLVDMKTKCTYQKINESVKKEIYRSIYGDYTDAIGSEEFYRRLVKNLIHPKGKDIN